MVRRKQNTVQLRFDVHGFGIFGVLSFSGIILRQEDASAAYTNFRQNVYVYDMYN